MFKKLSGHATNGYYWWTNKQQDGSVNYIKFPNAQPTDTNTLPLKPPNTLRIVAISDTHEYHGKLNLTVPSDCDVLVHGGDIFALGGDEAKLDEFLGWLAIQPFKHKIVIGGNHDRLLQTLGKQALKAKFAAVGATYLEDDETEIEGVRIWGSPHSSGCRSHVAFQDNPPFWKDVPVGVDILITHADRTDPMLQQELARINPKLHICGHLHNKNGVYKMPFGLSVNAAICGGLMSGPHKPHVVDFPLEN